MDRKRRIRFVKPIDYSKMKQFTNDELGLDSPERRQFLEEQKARAPYWDNYFATVDLSRFGSKVGVSYQNSKKLRKLIRQAAALKKRLEAHMKNHNPNKDSQTLLDSLGHVIRIVTRYYEATRDLPFDWIKKSFLPAEPRGSKLSYPDVESVDLLMGSKPAVTYVPSDDDECETVNGSESVEGPLKGPDFSRMSRLFPGIYRQLVYVYMRMGHGIQHFDNKNEEKLWQEFCEFDRAIREAEVTNPEFVDEKKRSIEADHPIVSVVGNFAVAAFNKACNKHVKKDEHENLHDFEFMECKYVKAYQFYHFYLIIEGIEEGNIGTYLAEVVCNSYDGVSMLCKFVLTDYEPSDDDECESVNVSETVERPFKDPDISRLGRLNLGFPSPLLYLCLQRRHGIHHFPDKDEQKIWLEFKKFDEGTREAEVINPEFVNEEMKSLEADHPIVSVVGNFAVAAFNETCRKEGEHKNLHDFEFMECKYLKYPQFYYST